MRITKIEMTGDTGSSAVMERPEGDEFIRVKLIECGRTHSHAVQADDADDRYSMAEILHEAFEGVRGTRGDVFPIASALELLAEQ